MATAGSVVVNLIANTGQFTKKMALSKRTVRSFHRAVGNVATRVRFLGIAAAGAAAGGLTLLTKRSMANIDAIAKLSDRIGVSTEFLSAYGHAATIAGTSQQDFSKAIEMYVRRLGEANMGTGEAKDALQALGIELDSILGQSPEESFLRIANGIRGLSTQADKAAVAYKLFGRSGSKMLNLLESDLSGVMEEAKRLGITFDRDMAAKVEKANDAIARLKATMTGLGNTMAVSMAKPIEDIADALSRLFTDESYELYAFISGLYDMEAAIFRVADAMTNLDELFNFGWTYSGEAAKASEKAAEAWARAEAIAGKIANRTPSNGGGAGGTPGSSEADLIARLMQDPGQFMKDRLNFSNIGLKSGVDSGPESFTPSAREIDTSQISVAGLAMSGKETVLSETKRQTGILQSIELHTRRVAGQEVLN